MITWRNIRWRRLAIGAGIGGSLLLHYIQGTRILALETAVAELHARGRLVEGDPVPNLLHVSGIDGKTHDVDYSDGPVVLYVFRPGCGWCQRNSPKARFLARRIAPNYRVIGLSLSSDGLPEFLRTYPLDFPIYTGLPASAITAYRLQTTPETIVVSRSGRVVTSWNGAYIGIRKSLIERFFSIQFPQPRGALAVERS
jgi:hypothetical protein